MTGFAPIVLDDDFHFTVSQEMSGNLLTNDKAGSNGRKFLRFFNEKSVSAKKPDDVTTIEGARGTFVVRADGLFRYTPRDLTDTGALSDQKPYETIPYKISDGGGQTDFGIFKLYVSAAPSDGRVTLTFEDDLTAEFSYKSLSFGDSRIIGQPGQRELSPPQGSTWNALGGSTFDLHEMNIRDGDGFSTFAITGTGPGVFYRHQPEDHGAAHPHRLKLDWKGLTEVTFFVNFAGTMYVYIDSLTITLHEPARA